MGSVNVNRGVSDAFYRYKMPRLMAKVEGKGNGIKTVIVNMADVAKALGRPATYPTKYFGCELGAQTQFDFKNDRFIVNGSHEASKLQDLLDGFIRKFVLCPECDNPETDLNVSTKRNIINQACKACGYHGLIESNHKLITFILKNPPTVNPALQGSSLTEGKRAKGKRKQNGDVNGDMNRSSSPKSDEEADIIVEAPLKVANENGENEDDIWNVDCSEEAVRIRMQDLTEGAKGLTITDDLEKTEAERIDIFYNAVKKALEEKNLDAKELLALADRLEVRSKAPVVLAELLFDDKIHIQMKKHRALLLRFTHDNPKAQKYLLGGIEQVIGLNKDALLPKVSAILKLFYDNDILEEKVLLDWGSHVSKKFVSKDLSQEIHQKAEPFLTWLKEAEEEESETDSEDDDDLEIEYNDRAKASPLKEQSKTVARPAVQENDDENGIDVDIDAI